jgi:microcystin degradation protein MlrC
VEQGLTRTLVATVASSEAVTDALAQGAGAAIICSTVPVIRTGAPPDGSAPPPTSASKASGEGPVVLADHSDRSGQATWLLREIVEQGLTRTLVPVPARRSSAARFR